MNTYRLGDLLQRSLVIALLLLGAIALSLFMMFHFISTTEIGEFTALSSFILVTALLIAGYMLGIIVLGFLAIYILPRILQQK